MPLTLLLRLPASGSDDSEWLMVDESGSATGPRQRGPLSLAAAAPWFWHPPRRFC